MTTATIKSNTPVLVVEINPHRQSSSVWSGAPTVGDVISIMQQTTASKTTQPMEFLLKNNRKTHQDFVSADGDFDGDAYNAWEREQPLEAHFEAAIDCAGDDGHSIKVYWTKADALDAGTPRYMRDEVYAKAVELVFA